MDLNTLNELSLRIKTIQEKIKAEMATIEAFNMTKVIVMGITGCGKSSLTSCLANNDVIIIQLGPGRKVQLDGPGIQGGAQSVTKEPTIMTDYKLQIAYIDCPGFDDTDGYNQEIVNAFVIDYLFKVTSNNKFKILLVISESEFDASRGQEIKNTLERMQKMFPKPGELERGIGLVVTKGDIELTNEDYIERMEENTLEFVQKWCHFFRTNLDRVFVFPQASKNDVGKRYDFEDHQKLEHFLLVDQIIDPVHKIALSENATLYMRSLGLTLSQKVRDIVRCIFVRITDNYLKDKSSFLLKKWLEWMNKLKERTIENSKELNEFIQIYFPRNYFFNYYIARLNDNEILNDFILKVSGVNYCDSVLTKTVASSVGFAIDELEQLKDKAVVCEQQKARRIEFENLLKLKRQKIEEEKRKVQQLQIEIDRKKIELERQRIEQANLQRRIRK